jgi:hypothetical protein
MGLNPKSRSGDCGLRTRPRYSQMASDGGHGNTDLLLMSARPDDRSQALIEFAGFHRRHVPCHRGETVRSSLSVDRHTHTRVDVAMHVAAGDAGTGIDVAADGAADHAGAGIDVSAHRAASDALPSVHVAGNHAAMNVAGNLEILQHPLDDVNLNPALHAILLPHIVEQHFAAFGDVDTVATERAAVDGDPRHGRRLQEQSGQFVTSR